jgi:hypothetical protein
VDWRSPWVIGGAAALMLLGAVALRYQARIEYLIDQVVLPRVMKVDERRAAANQPAEAPLEVVEYDAATH